MILHPENWMNIRRFRALHEAGASYAEIAAEVGCDWRTVKKYLAQGSPAVPPAGPSRRGTQPRKIGPFAGLVESWLRAGITLRASVICERLTASYGSARRPSGTPVAAGSWQASATTAARSAALIRRGRPGRGRSVSPSRPRAANRPRHLRTVSTLMPSPAAIRAFGCPRAAASTICARSRSR